MCGRFSFSKPEKQLLLNRFGLTEIKIDLKPRYNIAPSQKVPVIFNTASDILSDAQWGLIPSWAKDDKVGYKMINARAETVAEKPAYRTPFKSKRCLIIADSFYEWNKKGGPKTPYRFMMKNEDFFSFAGIYDEWNGITTCSIITTEPNDLMKNIHIRMPVILKKEDEKKWLSVKPDDAKELLKPYPSGEMKMYEISELINKPENDTIDVIKEFKREKNKGLGEFS
ncbi:SOS response-associated peptidase [Candidatus Woesearchaeota archaeon]|nr:SOS response-associated peptidase [Candidatus Woesearchaeota archaeon]